MKLWASLGRFSQNSWKFYNLSVTAAIAGFFVVPVRRESVSIFFSSVYCGY